MLPLPKEDIRMHSKVHCVGVHLLLSQRGLNPLHRAWSTSAGCASTFNQLGYYASSPSSVLTVMQQNSPVLPEQWLWPTDRRQYSLRLAIEGWPSGVGLGDWLNTTMVQMQFRSTNSQSSQYQVGSTYHNLYATTTTNHHRHSAKRNITICDKHEYL